MRARPGRRNQAIGACALAAVLVAGSVSLLAGHAAQAADPVAGDGTTSATAGASCWGIKQQQPSSADGVYWLNTASLGRPQQFWCDMTTDGGGWVLVARGREGWTFNPFGQGSPATVRDTVDGPAAFSPAALDTATITDLLAGQALDGLPDGIRLERALNSSGTNRQSYQLFPAYRAWTWDLAAGQLLRKVVVGNKTYDGSNTYDTSSNQVDGQTTNELAGRQGTDRMFTFEWTSHANKAGFSFGSKVNGGSSSSSSYLWTAGSEGSPIPFTRVWLRPRVANDAAGFSPIPADGFAAEAQPVTLKNRSEFAPWGVVGLDHTNETTIEPYNTNVLSMRVLGDRVFVGGRFTGVQNGPSASPIAQPFLAAFTLDGTWISSFRPAVNGRVWDMVGTDDGKLIIGGDFTSVDGAPDTQGMAALDPQTGEVITTWKARAYRSDGGRSYVRALDVRDGIVYAGGSFNRLAGGSWNPITVTNAIAVSAADGAPSTWRPRPSGSVVRLEVTRDAKRVLLAGYFSQVNGDPNQGYFGITDAATGATVPGIGPWTPSLGSRAKYQQAVADLGDGRILVGGSEHDTQLWNADRTQLLDAAITKQGGDTQAIEVFGDRAYVGCHCSNWIYEGTNNWTTPSGYRAVHPINLVGQWDATTWQYDTSWYPASLKGERGEGVWAIDQDHNGCLWVGGDLNRGGWSGNAANDWLGGFARFCREDSTPPSAPTALRSQPSGRGVELSWGASTDDSGTVAYDVYRDDRVIATTWARSYTDPVVNGAHRYTVRAADARDNRSASPAPIAVNGPSPVIAQPVAFGSTWRYLATGTDQGTAWRAPGFDASAWPAGPGRLGWGRSDLATVVGPARPLTTYFRSQFSVADPTQVRALDLRLYDHQGAVVYVNGIEAGRFNLPAGRIAATTPASGYLPGAEESAVRTMTVPGSLLVAGTNTIAVEVHNVTANAGRLLFDLQATLYGSGGDAAAPTAPTATGSAGTSGPNLSWTASSDDTTLGGYLVRRDGAPVAVTGPGATTFTDGEASAAAHTYVITAFDTNGNATSSAPVTVGVAADPNLLSADATWRWFYAEGGPGAGWQAAGFDDAAWASGRGELGYGDSDERTVISTSPTPRPLTAYFRTTIEVADPAAFTSVVASLVRDDGAVVYVNGVEVGRDNMPAGQIDFSTPASTIISDRKAERTPVTITIPASAFTPGTNVIAVEVHNNDRWSGDLSMALSLTGRP
jgi:hypothetical protein